MRDGFHKRRFSDVVLSLTEGEAVALSDWLGQNSPANPYTGGVTQDRPVGVLLGLIRTQLESDVKMRTRRIKSEKAHDSNRRYEARRKMLERCG